MLKKKKKTPEESKKSPGKEHKSLFVWVEYSGEFFLWPEKDAWDGSLGDFHRTRLIFVEGWPNIEENI